MLERADSPWLNEASWRPSPSLGVAGCEFSGETGSEVSTMVSGSDGCEGSSKRNSGRSLTEEPNEERERGEFVVS